MRTHFLVKRMQNRFTAKLLNRLSLGTGVSLLLHLFVLISIIPLFKLDRNAQNKTEANILEVRFAPPTPSQTHTKSNPLIISSMNPAAFNADQTNIQKPAEPRIATLPTVEKSTLVAEAIEGISLPGAISTPFQGQARTTNPFSWQVRGAQQDAKRTYQQQTAEAQTRQHAEKQEQLMILQLQQMLAKLLERHPGVAGNCALSKSDTGLKNSLQCDSAALHELLHKDQQIVEAMLIILRGMGRVYSGISVTNRNNMSFITLNSDALPGTYEKEATSLPPP